MHFVPKKILALTLIISLPTIASLGCGGGSKEPKENGAKTSVSVLKKEVTLQQRYQFYLAQKGLGGFNVYIPFKEQKPIFIRLERIKEQKFEQYYNLSQRTVVTYHGYQGSYNNPLFLGMLKYHELPPVEQQTMQKLEDVHNSVTRDLSNPGSNIKPQTPAP